VRASSVACYDSQVFVKKAPGATTADARAAVRAVATRYSGTTVMDVYY
jgi:hypothetical protein